MSGTEFNFKAKVCQTTLEELQNCVKIRVGGDGII